MADSEDSTQPIEVADLSERRRKIADERFFEIRRPQSPDCTHQWRGVTLDIGTRRVFCKCGEQIDSFDALLIYAHAETRLVSTRESIEEHKRKEAEKKARRPHFKKHVGFARRSDNSGFDVRLECGHSAFWDTRRRTRFRSYPPRGMTCLQCVRDAELKARGVATLLTGHEPQET